MFTFKEALIGVGLIAVGVAITIVVQTALHQGYVIMPEVKADCIGNEALHPWRDCRLVKAPDDFNVFRCANLLMEVTHSEGRLFVVSDPAFTSENRAVLLGLARKYLAEISRENPSQSELVSVLRVAHAVCGFTYEELNDVIPDFVPTVVPIKMK